jgi:uncharacterized protein YjbI with pentapeptide repeats
MTKPIDPHLLELLERHDKWSNDPNNPNFAKLNLEDVDFSDLDLSKRYLGYAELPGANFDRSRLSWADLHEAHLGGASFVGADLSFVDITKANLDYASLKDANLQGVRAIKTSFYHANLQGTNLMGADLHGASFYDANLEGAVLRDTSLNGIHLEAVRLFCTDLLGASGLDLIYVDWIDVGPEGAPIRLEGEEAQAWMMRRARGEEDNQVPETKLVQQS